MMSLQISLSMPVNNFSNSSSKRLVLLVAVAVFVPVLFFKRYFFLSSKGKLSQSAEERLLQMASLDVLAEDIPQESLTEQGEIAVHNNFTDVKGIKVFYREALPLRDATPTHHVLLLHGQAFTSQNWLTLNTLSLLAAWGHRAVAVDLPGYGKTSGSVENPSDFVLELVRVLQLAPSLVIVSPSMSGRFSLPFLVSHPEKVKGYVPVAPVHTEKYVDKFPSIQVPTVIVVGELDAGIGPVSVKNLSLLPRHTVVEFPKARHPAYLDQPGLWHQTLYNFLKHL